jgi:hypothetical protein
MTGINIYISILTLNLNRLSSLIKRHHSANGLIGKIQQSVAYRRPIYQLKQAHRVNGWKKIYQANDPESRQE